MLLISLFFGCSSNKFCTIEEEGETFITADSVFSVTPAYEFEQHSFMVELRLTKLKADDSNYFPNSEQLRVVIKDMKGNEILNTNSGNYTLAINEVLPKEVGKTQGYVYRLSGVTFIEENDEIDLTLMLPIKPNPIVYNTKVVLKK
ncbi:MAG: hypothetical protein ACE364_05210 [Chlorobiota bacterium]